MISKLDIEQLVSYAELASETVERGPIYGNTWAVLYATDIPKLISALLETKEQLDAYERGNHKPGG